MINKDKYPNFSVAISVYEKDNPIWFDCALESIIVQTVKPDEIVLIVDGPVPETIKKVIKKYTDLCNKKGIVLKAIKLKVNGGLGNALRIAVGECKNNLIARMDSDDIACESRFEQQLKFMVNHPEVDLLGGDIVEFVDDIHNVIGKRIVPCDDKEIKEYMKIRCPFNHVTVMYKKEAVQKSGSYLDLFWNEDYYLWIRMLEQGCVMANTGTILVNVRTSSDMYKRRGGINYFRSEKFLQEYMLERNIITKTTYLVNVLKRFVVQCVLPNSIRGWVFKRFAREK